VVAELAAVRTQIESSTKHKLRKISNGPAVNDVIAMKKSKKAGASQGRHCAEKEVKTDKLWYARETLRKEHEGLGEA